MVLNESELVFVQCKGHAYKTNGHTCNILISKLLEIQKTKTLNPSTITNFIKTINTNCFINYNNEITNYNRPQCVNIIYEYIKNTEDLQRIMFKNSFVYSDFYYVYKLCEKFNVDKNYNLIKKIYDYVIENDLKNQQNYNYGYDNGIKSIDFINYIFHFYKLNLIKIDENKLMEVVYNNFNTYIFVDDAVYSYNNVNAKIKKIVNEILTYLISNKNFNASYDNFIRCLVYDKFKNAQIMLASPLIKIKNTSIIEYLKLLFRTDLSARNFDDITNCVNFLVENNFDKNIDVSELILNYLQPTSSYRSRYGRNYSNPHITKIYEYIFNTLVDNGCMITKNDLLKLLELRIHIKNPQKCKINIEDDDISALCYSNSYNPYNLKFKYTQKLLESECDKSGNLKRIKEISKTIQPTVKCLENACNYKNNYAAITFLTKKNIKVNINCLANSLKSNGGSNNYYYIVTSFYNDNKQKIEQPIKEDINEAKDDDNASIDSKNSKNSDKKKKVIIKKIIKKVVKKKTDEAVKTDETKSDLKPKKVVKKKSTISIEENKSDETESAKSTKSDLKPKKVVKKKSTISIEENKSDGTETDEEENEIINFDTYLIPNNYNYRNKYKLKIKNKNIKKLFEDSEEETHLDVRRKLLTYLKENNKLKQDIEIDNIKFKLANIDKFISAYVIGHN
jgi:hypothetical protein